MDDPSLVRAVRGGDAAAFAAIFDRYAARVHDLALALLRDRALALEVVEATFLEASLRLHALTEDHRLAVWLLAVTRRNAALRAGPTAGPDRQPTLGGDDPERAQLAGLIWEAVADLPLRERALIDLDLRQGLDGQDLADALGVTPRQAQELQARMRDRIEKGLSGYLIAKTAMERTPDLAKVLKGWNGRFTPATADRIARHVQTSRSCNEIRFGLPSPFALYAAGLPAPFPAAVRPRVLERITLPVVATVPAAPPDGPPTEALGYQYPMAAAPLPEPAAFAAPPVLAPPTFPAPPPEPEPSPPVADAAATVEADPNQLPPAPPPFPAPPAFPSQPPFPSPPPVQPQDTP